MIPRSIALLLHGDRIKLFTDSEGNPGRNVRDWTYVSDNVHALREILLNGNSGEIYCIGGNNQVSNQELVTNLLVLTSEATGVPMSFGTHVELVQDRPGHDRRYAVDTSKIERELGWKPQVLFEAGLRNTVAWYTSSFGRNWLDSKYNLTAEVREGQNRSVERK